MAGGAPKRGCECGIGYQRKGARHWVDPSLRFVLRLVAPAPGAIRRSAQVCDLNALLLSTRAAPAERNAVG